MCSEVFHCFFLRYFGHHSLLQKKSILAALIYFNCVNSNARLVILEIRVIVLALIILIHLFSQYQDATELTPSVTMHESLTSKIL